MNILKTASSLILLLFLSIGHTNGQSETADLGSQKSPATELTDVSEIPEDSMLAFQESPYNRNNAAKKKDIDCRYANCRVKISKLKAIYQPWADAKCKTKRFRVVCCNNEGETVVLWVVIKPRSPHCKYPNVFQHFPEGQ